MDVYPLRFEPIYVEKIWGGRNLERLYGRSLPEGKKIGESWELADLPSACSIVAEGPARGRTLAQLMQQWGAELLGPARPTEQGRFPLLLKFLDANDILSLQVHPDAAAVKRLAGSAALKTECWYVVESRNGYIYKGLQPGITPEQFRRAVEDNTAERVVRKVDVAAGDFHYLPAGTVHALGPGVVVAEVQTPSDTTYRVTDWGRGREIHLEQSMQCIHFEPADDAAPGAEGEKLLETQFFTVYKHTIQDANRSVTVSDGRCVALMLVGGDGPVKIQSDRAGDVDAKRGDTILIPAAAGTTTLAAQRSCQFLRITLPEN